MQDSKVLSAHNNWILVDKIQPVKEEKIGTIAVINNEKDADQNMGKVISVGRDVDLNIHPGNTVVWGDWPGAKIRWQKKTYYAIRSTDVILAG